MTYIDLYQIFFCSNLVDESPDPADNGVSLRILHSYWSYRNELLAALPLSIFLDNLKVYDFVLHAEDVQRIYREGKYTFFVQTATSDNTISVSSNIKESSRIVLGNSFKIFENPGKKSV